MKSFQNLRFVTKLWLLIGAVGLVGAGAALLLASLVTSYEQVLTTEVRQQDTARKAQVTFKKQIQEWKDILLRGYDPEQLTKYTDQYHAREKEVKDITSALGKELTDPKAKALVGEFIKAHDQMTSHYDTALRAFTDSKGLAQREARIFRWVSSISDTRCRASRRRVRASNRKPLC
jgi:hypothetical protein